MIPPMLPASALRLASTAGTAVLVENARGQVVHVYTFTRRRHAPTPAGNLHRADRPVCGNHARRWHVTRIQPGQPLCRSCAAWVERHHAGLHPTPADLHATVEAARTLDEVTQAAFAVALSGLVGQHVHTSDGNSVPLHRLVAIQRSHVTLEQRRDEQQRQQTAGIDWLRASA